MSLRLGIPEEASSWSLESRFFPSKVGGKPAWLALKGIPRPGEELTCPRCHENLAFLMQVYAPETNSDSTFHRTLFVFFCRKALCHRDDSSEDIPFVVFRSQLPKENPFYPSRAPTEAPSWHPECIAKSHATLLCAVCGCPGDKRCGGCKGPSYCSKNHQTWHWRQGGHKGQCKQHQEQDCTYDGPNKYNLPEFEIVDLDADDEDYPESEEDDDDLQPEERKKYANMSKEGKTGTLTAQDVSEVDGNQANDEDECFNRFKSTVSHTSSQVLRYWRRGHPLWISQQNRLEQKDVPPCKHCGGRRVFEFQIMPQLLRHLNLDQGGLDVDCVDWGVLNVYTCEDSCDGKLSEADIYYTTEYIFRQNITASKQKA